MIGNEDIYGLTCCFSVLIITCILLSVLLLRLVRGELGHMGGRTATKALVSAFTFVLVIQFQIYYEGPGHDIRSEHNGPEFEYFNTNVSVALCGTGIGVEWVGDWDAILLGGLGVVAYISCYGDTVRLMRKISTDGLNWTGPYPELMLDKWGQGVPGSYRCDLEVDQGRIVCVYSCRRADTGASRYEWTVTTIDGNNWSAPQLAVKSDQVVPVDGFRLPKALAGFAWTDVGDIDVLRTQSGGTLVGIGYYSHGLDFKAWAGTFFAMEDPEGGWTPLVTIPAGWQWEGPVKLHEPSAGQYMAVGLFHDHDFVQRIAYVQFPERALMDVVGPIS